MRAGRILGRCCATAVALLVAAPAVADGPVYLPENGHGTRTLTIDDLSGWTEFLYHDTHARAGDFVLDETIVSPGIHGEARGSLYHERLAAFRLDGTLSWQSRSFAGAANGTSEVSFRDYGAAVDLLRKHATSLTLSTARRTGWLTSPFRSSVRTLSRTRGAELRTTALPLPLTVSWTREEFTEDLLGGERTTERTALQASGRHRIGDHGLTYRLRRDDFRKNVQTQDVRTDGGDLGWSLRRDRLHLRADHRYRNRYGTIDRTDLSLSQSASADLGRGLDGTVSHIYQRFRSGGDDAPWTAAHNLDARLEGSRGPFDLGLILDVYDEQTTRDTESLAALSRISVGFESLYRTAVPAGDLTLGWGHRRGHESRRSALREYMTADELHVLSDGTPARLEHPDVIAGSIVVTDPSGFAVYLEGLDYEISVIGSATFLDRLPSGDIPPDGDVAVDYAYTLSPGSEFFTVGNTVRADLRGPRIWSLRYRYENHDEDPTEPDPGDVLQSRTRNLYGAELDWRAWTLDGESEVVNLLETRYRSRRARLDWSANHGPNRVSAGLSHTWTRTNGHGRRQRFFQAHARATGRVRRNLTLESEVWLRLDRGEAFVGDQQRRLVGARLRATYRFRALLVELAAQIHDAERNDAADDRSELRLGVRRMF